MQLSRNLRPYQQMRKGNLQRNDEALNHGVSTPSSLLAKRDEVQPNVEMRGRWAEGEKRKAARQISSLHRATLFQIQLPALRNPAPLLN